MGVLVLVAGVELYTNMAVAGLTALQVAGLLFALHGLGTVVHVAGLCPQCKSCSTDKK